MSVIVAVLLVACFLIGYAVYSVAYRGRPEEKLFGIPSQYAQNRMCRVTSRSGYGRLAFAGRLYKVGLDHIGKTLTIYLVLRGAFGRVFLTTSVWVIPTSDIRSSDHPSDNEFVIHLVSGRNIRVIDYQGPRIDLDEG